MALTLTPQLRYFDERYGGKTNQLKHFLLLSQLGLTSSLFDDQHKTYISFQQFTFKKADDWIEALRNLEKILPTEEFQQNSSLQVCVSNQLYTLVPQALFDEKELETYLSFNHPIEDNSQLKYHSTKLEGIDAVAVFAIPRSMEFMLKAKLPPHQLIHFSSPLIESIGLEKMKPTELLIHIQADQFEIVHAPNGKLKFFNTFQYTSKEDFIYYLLYVMEQLKIERETAKLILVGEIEKESAIFKLLYTYINEVTFGKTAKNIEFSAVLAELNKHSNYCLFNQHLCG